VSDKADLVREGMRRFVSGDEQGLLELFHPEIEVWVTDEQLNSGTFKGREAVQRWYSDWHEPWEHIEYELLDFIDVSEMVMVVPVKASARARDGLEVSQHVAWMFELRDGLLGRWELHSDTEAALASARLWLTGQNRR
jgi:ketosteroid isomerase-like protein